MEKLPLLWKGKLWGELRICREGETCVFSGEFSLPGEGLWSVWILGARGEMRLGLPWACGTGWRIEKRFSRRMTDPLGDLFRGELRCPEQQCGEDWRPLEEAAAFRTVWLERQLRSRAGVLWRGDAGGGWVAIPFDPKRPFPMMPMFCFASCCRIRGKYYLVVCLDRDEQPKF